MIAVGLWIKKTDIFCLVFRPPFENQTIRQPATFEPFKYQTWSVFRWFLWYESIRIILQTFRLNSPSVCNRLVHANDLTYKKIHKQLSHHRHRYLIEGDTTSSDVKRTQFKELPLNVVHIIFALKYNVKGKVFIRRFPKQNCPEKQTHPPMN